MEHILQLGWDDHAIPHKIWIEQYYDGCRICLKVVKDVEPEMLSLIVPNIDVQTTHKAWQGKATNITPAYDDGGVVHSNSLAIQFASRLCDLGGNTYPDAKPA